MKATDLVKSPNGNLIDIRQRRIFQKGVEWILADDTGSMQQYVPNADGTYRNAMRRIDALNNAISSFGEHVQTIAFGPPESTHKYIGPVKLEARAETTFLSPALLEVQKYEPNYIIIISDGKIERSNWAKCEMEATHLANNCIIDTLYIGPDDPIAEGFMQRLATIGNGRFKRYDITKPNTLSLTQVVQGLLPPPEEIING